jgi:hypothetical protein
LILFELLSYSLLFSNFRWFILTAQPARALDAAHWSVGAKGLPPLPET